MNSAIRCIAVIFIGAATLLQAQEPPQIALDQNSIAILPIEVLTDDPKGPELAASAYQELISQLGSIDGLIVVDQSRVDSFGESELAANEIAKELGVDNIVQASIQLWPPYYVLQLKFIKAQDGRSRSGTSSLIGVTDPTIKCAINPETALPDGISEVVTSVEQWIYPVAEPTREQKAVTARAVFMDTNVDDLERLRSMKYFAPPRLGGVFPAQYAGSVDNLTGSVAVAAVQLGLESKDESVRHGMWYRMAGVGDLYLVEPLIKSLRNDEDVWVRAQAAMTLVDFLDEPGVRENLDYARINDSEKMVRKAANFSLLSPSERLANHRETVLDPTESDSDRSAALRGLRPGSSNAEPYDEEVISTAINLAKQSRSARIRQSVWYSLGTTNDPAIIEAMILALDEDPAERVRESVVMLLGARLADEPEVREAIEYSRINDASPLVRKRAEDAMRLSEREAQAAQR